MPYFIIIVKNFMNSVPFNLISVLTSVADDVMSHAQFLPPHAVNFIYPTDTLPFVLSVCKLIQLVELVEFWPTSNRPVIEVSPFIFVCLYCNIVSCR